MASLKQRNLPEVYLALSNFDLSLKWCINIPTMIVVGGDDKIISKEDVQLTANILRAKKYIKIPYCGHSPFIDCPNYLAQEIGAFIKNVL